MPLDKSNNDVSNNEYGGHSSEWISQLTGGVGGEILHFL